MDVSPTRRLLLAFSSLLFTWLGYTAILLIAATWFINHLEVGWLIAWAGAFALITFFLFVLPLVGLWKSHLQIRYWYILLGASLLWGEGIVSLVLRQSPISMLQEGFPAACMPIWLACFSICSSTLYLLLLLHLLKRTARNAREKYNPA
jgi:hypothetical protein